MKIKELLLDESFEVLGHIFHGLKEVREAVAITATPGRNWKGERNITAVQPKKRVPGLYVALVYQDYPCFDSYDYASEDRRYCNFFFSDGPFMDDDIARLTDMPSEMNCCYVHEDMDVSAAPAMYWEGDSHKSMFLATI